MEEISETLGEAGPRGTELLAGGPPDRAHPRHAVAAGERPNTVFDPLLPLKTHPVYAIAGRLADYMGVEKDLIQFVEFLSLAAGRMVMPVNLDIQTDCVGVDLHLANRVLDLRHGHVARVDTHRQFRALERDEFLLHGPVTVGYSNAPDDELRSVAAVLIRGNHQLLHREVSEYTARLLGADFTMPSLWRVSDLLAGLPPVSTTLRLQATQTCRGLDDFGHAFAGYRCRHAEDELAALIESLPFQPRYPCHFRQHYRGKARPELMLVLERFLAVFVALRIQSPGEHDKQPEILAEDYRALRSLLTCLPLVPLDRGLTPQAILTGDALFEAAQASSERLELPDLSMHGEKWFTRRDAMRWTDLGYNTVKKHLRQLEEEGIVLSTVAENNRERGKQIHFCFVAGRSPPFEWRNPFSGLPELVSPGGG